MKTFIAKNKKAIIIGGILVVSVAIWWFKFRKPSAAIDVEGQEAKTVTPVVSASTINNNQSQAQGLAKGYKSAKAAGATQATLDRINKQAESLGYKINPNNGDLTSLKR